MKKIIALMLSLSMIFALCACGSGQEQNNIQKDSAEKTESATEAAAEPNYIYAAETSSILQGSKVSLIPVVYTDTGVYCRSYEKTGERELREGEVLEFEGQLDIYEQCMYFVTYEGNVTRLEAYKPIKVERTAPEEYRTDSNEPEGYSVAVVGTSDGKLISIDEVYESWNTAPSNCEMYSDEWYQYSNYNDRFFIRVINADGSEESLNQIILPEDQYFGLYGATILDDDHVIVGAEGNLLKIALDGTFEIFDGITDGYIEKVINLSGDKIGFSAFDDGYKLYVVDRKTLKTENTYSLPTNAYDVYPGMTEDDIVYVNGINTYNYNLKTGVTEKMFNWLSLDVDAEELSNFKITSDGTIIGIVNNWDRKYTSNNVGILRVSLVPESSVPKKQVITLATEYMDYETRRLILDFNRRHNDIRIEAATYSEFNTEQDWSAGRTKLLTEIMAGQVPDIIDLAGLPKAQFAAKGLLEDLYPYIDNDSSMKREDYFENVLKACEIDGKLYNTLSSFRLYSCAGAKSIVGDRIGWTYDDVIEALSNLPEGADIFDKSTTQGDMLNICMSLEMGSFVDWNKGVCKFDSQEFANLLKFVSLFKSEYDWESYEWSEEETVANRIMSGKQMLMNAYLYDFSDMMYYGHYFGGEENVSFIGFPTNDGSNGSALEFGGTEFAMSSKCSDKAAAWEFLRELMTEEYQESSYSGYPSNINAFMTKLEEAKTPNYAVDSNGNRLLNENGEYILQAKITYGDETGEYKIYNMSDEMAETVLELVKTTTKVVKNDESIMAIVAEQTAPFFAGQKTAEEVARFVQSKANIYINEQK